MVDAALWPRLELLILQLAYYEQVVRHDASWPCRQTRSAYHRDLVAEFRACNASISELDATINRLVNKGMVLEVAPFTWRLTEHGNFAAYNLCEYQIQMQSGLWREVSNLIGREMLRGIVVDVGSAGGLASITGRKSGLFTSDIHYVGVDRDKHTLRYGSRLVQELFGAQKNFHLVQADGLRLPFSSLAVDMVLSRGAMYYMDRRLFMAEMARVLTKGGRLIVVVPSWSHTLNDAIYALSRGRLRAGARFVCAVCIGGLEWVGLNVPRIWGAFTAETGKAVARSAKAAGFEIEFLQKIDIPYTNRPLLLVARKSE